MSYIYRGGKVMKFLKENMQWCVWKYIDTGKKKLAKVPFNPITKKTISVSKADDFLPFEVVSPFLKDYDGLGIRVLEPLVAIDIDDCVIEDKLTPLALEVVKQFSSAYIEYSPSKKGLRLFCLMSPNFVYDTKTYKMKGNKVEVYIGGHTNRFVTFTGKVYQEGVIDEQPDKLKWLLDTHLKREKMPQNPIQEHSYLSDTAVLQKASKAKNGEKFKNLWSGDITNCSSHSEADLALCSILAFYCGGDKKQIDRLFRQSALFRDKWDERHGADTYGNLTIFKAISSLSSTYQPVQLDEFNDNLTRLKQEFQFPSGAIYSWNDIGAGKLFADFYQDTLRYVPERKAWFIYQDGIWKSDTGNLMAMKSAMELANLIHLCAIDVLDEDKRKKFQMYASRWQSHSYRIAILKDAQVYYPIQVSDFDKDPHLLNCRNGTYHLKKKNFYPHQSKDLLTKMTNVTYDLNAVNIRWNQFIEEIMTQDKEKSLFLQKILGYGLSGDTQYECLFILHGVTTRNGK